MSIQINNSSFQVKLPEVFERALIALKEQKPELTDSQYKYALGFIRGLGIVEKHADELVEIRDETKRNHRINQLTNLGAEPGLFPGRDPEQIKKSIAIRVNNFVMAFNKSEEQQDLLSFFVYGFLGAPCFNGRMITLENYLYERYGIKSQLYYEKKEAIDGHAQELEECMYEYAEKIGLEEESVPTLDQMKTYLGSKWFQGKGPIEAIYSRACEFYL